MTEITKGKYNSSCKIFETSTKKIDWKPITRAFIHQNMIWCVRLRSVRNVDHEMNLDFDMIKPHKTD